MVTSHRLRCREAWSRTDKEVSHTKVWQAGSSWGWDVKRLQLEFIWKVDLVCCCEQRQKQQQICPKNYLPVHRLCQVNLWINIIYNENKIQVLFSHGHILLYPIPLWVYTRHSFKMMQMGIRTKHGEVVISLVDERLWCGGGGGGVCSWMFTNETEEKCTKM